MTAPPDEYAFDLRIAQAAAERWAARGDHHAKFEAAARENRYSEIDTPERCVNRANRLLGKLGESRLRGAAATEFGEAMGADIDKGMVGAETVSDEFLERVIGTTRDFLFVEFLESALFVSKSVGRITTKLSSGRRAYGTGFMVSPSLLITNHHVFPTASAASQSTIEFGYQRNRRGQMLESQIFQLDPAAFFVNDKELDFALVAVVPGRSGRPLSDYGWCPLIGEQGKIITGEPINIVQHPRGGLKQVVIRENRLLDAFGGTDRFLHYEADTEPGSSGSPVFNDQWEVVALHHSGVPKRDGNDLLDIDGRVWRKGDDPLRLAWVANEGIRVSKLVEFMKKAKVTGDAKRLLAEFLSARPPEPALTPPEPPKPQPVFKPHEHEEEEKPPMANPMNAVRKATVNIPLQVTVTVEVSDSGGPDLGTPVVKPKTDPNPEEAVNIDPDYSNRPGYDSEFLGFAVPFPRLTSVTRPKAFALPGVSGNARYELKYYHYSVLFNKERKLAFAAGVNYDPTAAVQFKREKDKWSYDPRVTPKEELQAGEDLYRNNPLDRGHLVRRADAGWGATEEEAKLANDDTFHFTNCSPQHAITNQGKTQINDNGRTVVAPPGLKLWGKLEDHVASQGKAEGRKLCVFNGPVFRPTDQLYRGIQIPQEFWKMVVFANDDGAPAAAAFILTQAELIQDLQEEFEVGEYEAVQVRLKELESRTHLDFGPLTGWDVLEREGAHENFTGDVPAVVLKSLADIVL